MWVNTIQKALTKSCVHKYQRDLYLLVEKRCQTEKKMSSLRAGSAIRVVSLWRPPQWSPPVERWRALGGSSCSSAPKMDCTRKERTGPRTPSAWPPNTAPSPTSPSPPSDARFPAEDTTVRVWGERSWVEKDWTSVIFYMHNCDTKMTTKTGTTLWFYSLGPFLRQKWE